MSAGDTHAIQMTQQAGGDAGEDGGAANPEISTDENNRQNQCPPHSGQPYRILMDGLGKAGKEEDGTAMVVMKTVAVLVLGGMAAALYWSLTREGREEQPVLWCYLTLLMMLAFGFWAVKFLTFLVSWPIKRWLRFQRYTVYLMEGLKGSVDATLFLCAVLASSRLWILPRVKIWIIPDSQVFRLLIALCVGSFLRLIKNTLYYMLEAEVRYLRLFERIRLSIPFLHAYYLVELQRIRQTQRDPGVKDTGESLWEATPSDKLWMPILQMERKSVPIWILRQLSREYLLTFKRNPQLCNEVGLIKGDDFKLRDQAEEAYNQITRPRMERPVDLLNPQDPCITREDVSCFELSREELDFIFLPPKHKYLRTGIREHPQRSTDVDITISFDRFHNLLVKGCKICWNLKKNLEGSIKMFVKLNRILNAFVFLVVLIIWLLLSQLVSVAQIALLFSPILAATFIFGESLKNMFGGLIFAFGMHPFEVGDRVIIDGIQMRVTDLNILTSIFMKYDTEEEVVIPNTMLYTTKIINAGEEVIVPNLSDNIEFPIDARTSFEGIQYLETNIVRFMEYTEGHYRLKVLRAAFGKKNIRMKVSFDYTDRRLSAEEKEIHKSRMLSIIMKLVKEMEMTMQERLPSYTMEIRLDPIRKARMEDIEDIEAEIIRGLGMRCPLHSKVVIGERGKVIETGLYVREDQLGGGGDLENQLRQTIPKSLLQMKKSALVREVRVSRNGVEIVALDQETLRLSQPATPFEAPFFRNIHQ